MKVVEAKQTIKLHLFYNNFRSFAIYLHFALARGQFLQSLCPRNVTSGNVFLVGWMLCLHITLASAKHAL